MVGQHDAIEACVEGELDVVGRHDALEQQRQGAGLAPEPCDVVPAEARVDEVAHDAAEAAAPLVVFGFVGDHGAGERLVGANALVGFALAGRGGVDGHVDGGDVGRLCVEFAEQGLGLGALAVDVELKEEGVLGAGGGGGGGGGGGSGRGDFGGRVGGGCADALDDAFGGAGAGEGELAVGVDEAGHCGRGDLGGTGSVSEVFVTYLTGNL